MRNIERFLGPVPNFQLLQRDAHEGIDCGSDDGEKLFDRVSHLVDKKGRHYALTLKAGETFQHSGDTIPHDELIGKSDGSLVTLSRGKKMLALSPTLAEYTLKMPRGAQVLYPKELLTLV